MSTRVLMRRSTNGPERPTVLYGVNSTGGAWDEAYTGCLSSRSDWLLMPSDVPTDRRVDARQAYGFFYLQPEEESSALSLAKRPLRSRKEAYEQYLGTAIVDEMLKTSSLQEFLQHMHYRIRRDGEGRIVCLLRRDDPPINPALDYEVLKEIATCVLGAELVFSNEFGDGWEWKADGDALTHCSGHVTVESKGA